MVYYGLLINVYFPPFIEESTYYILLSIIIGLYTKMRRIAEEIAEK